MTLAARELKHNAHVGTPELARLMAAWCLTTIRLTTGTQYQSRVCAHAPCAHNRPERKFCGSHWAYAPYHTQAMGA
jgi:hypothetical protein